MITRKKRWGPCLAIPTRLHAIMEERETFSKKNKSISSKEGEISSHAGQNNGPLHKNKNNPF